jgi:hypothetical protein
MGISEELQREFNDVLFCSCFTLPEPCEKHKNREDVVERWGEAVLPSGTGAPTDGK